MGPSVKEAIVAKKASELTKVEYYSGDYTSSQLEAIKWIRDKLRNVPKSFK